MKCCAYEKNYYYEEDYWWFVGRRIIILDMIKKYISKEKNKVFDYGCGTGIMMEYLSSFGEVWGGDISEISLDYCKRRGLTNVVNLKKKLSIPDKYYDLITVLDVLEHIDKDEDLLRKLRSYLNNDGILIITVLAYDFLWSGEDYVSGHKRRYTLKTLRQKIETNGFCIKRISYFNSILLPLMILVIWVKKAFCSGNLYESNLRKLPALVNISLTGIFMSESKILKLFSFPFGASIICVASKGQN